MKRYGVIRMLIVAAAFVCGFASFEPSQDSFSLTIQGAEARVGRPATPVSVAGVARRQTRRAVVGGAAVGAAAAGTACVRVPVNGSYVCH